MTETTGLHGVLAVVGDAHRRRQVLCGEAAIERPAFRLARDVERHAGGVARERPRRQHHPGVLLGGRIGRQIARRLDPLHRLQDRRPRCVALRGERHEGGGITQRRAVVGAAELELGLRRDVGQRRRIDPLGARTVAQHAECRCELRLGDRGLQLVQLGIGEVAQVAERRHRVAREHVIRIGQLAVDRLGRIALPDVIAQPVERQAERHLRHREVALARAGQEVGHVGVEPHVVAARAPQAERAVRALARENALDRVADALVDRAVERELRLVASSLT
jgi:hypothetical protein